MDNVCYRCLFSIPSKVEMAEEQEYSNPTYLEEWQITEYWKSRLNNADFLTFQNVRQNHFHDVAKFEKKITEGKLKYWGV